MVIVWCFEWEFPVICNLKRPKIGAIMYDCWLLTWITKKYVCRGFQYNYTIRSPMANHTRRNYGFSRFGTPTSTDRSKSRYEKNQIWNYRVVKKSEIIIPSNAKNNINNEPKTCKLKMREWEVAHGMNWWWETCHQPLML